MLFKQAKSSISLGLYKFSSFALFFLILFSTITSIASASDVPYTKNPKDLTPMKDLDCNMGSGGFSNTDKDVNCRCPKDSCRLSTGISNGLAHSVVGSYSCIQGNTTPAYYLGKDDGLNFYTDTNYFKRVLDGFGAVSIDPKTSLYLDSFNYETSQSTIPAGSFCKVNPADTGGVAYWYYPGYFNVLQEKDPFDGLDNGNPATSGACAKGTRILFSTTDLYGKEVSGTQTFFGCLPNSLNGIVAFLVRLVSGLAILIALLIVGINLILIIMNSTNPDAVQEAQKKMSAAIVTLVGILLTITILSIFGLQIVGFGSDGFGGSIFKFFVGG